MGRANSTAADLAEVVAYFDRLRTEPQDTQIRGLSGTCRFDIEPVGSWLVIVNDGHVEAQQGGGPADSVVGCTADEFLSVVRDGQNGFTAALQGRLRVSGNLAVLQLLRRLEV
ncbi:MAG: SCP2 sterol-binding domain-containing protein [Ktedonobacterales bacterium]